MARTCCHLRNTFDDQAHINPRPVNESMCQSTDVRFHQSYRYRKVSIVSIYSIITKQNGTIIISANSLTRISHYLHTGLFGRSGAVSAPKDLDIHSWLWRRRWHYPVEPSVLNLLLSFHSKLEQFAQEFGSWTDWQSSIVVR